MSKKNKHKKAAERRRREMERLQKAIQKQAEERAAAPPPPAPATSQPQPIVNSPFAALQPPDLMETGDELWDRFAQADKVEKEEIYLETLASGQMDDEYAYEMLEGIRNTLDTDKPSDRARYAELVERLKQDCPAIYQQSFAYYNSSMIRDAIADERWDALPELLAPFAGALDKGIDMFYQILDQLLYHGQIEPLIQVLENGRQTVAQSNDLFPETINEVDDTLIELHLFRYLETAAHPQDEIAALREATTSYGEWKPDWLERFVPRFTATAPSNWQPADFDDTVDADQWRDNLQALIAEFIATQHHNDIPYSRAYIIWGQLNDILGRQYLTPTMPRSKRKGRHHGKRRGDARVQPKPPTLIPGYHQTEKKLLGHFQFLNAKPYRAVALVEFLPSYLHFLAHLGLIHPKEMDNALSSLNGLVKYIPRILESYAVDPIAKRNVSEAWAKLNLAALRNDPDLVHARSHPPAKRQPPQEPAPRRPGALQVYTFKVTYLHDPEVWRTIEIAEHQTLHDLHNTIQDAVDFDNDHLYSFYMNGDIFDDTAEYTHPRADGHSAARANIGDLNLRKKHRFVYLFDYGDKHQFEVQLISVNPDAPKADYPRVIEKHGDAPSQYPYAEEWDDEWDEDAITDDEWSEDDEA